MNKPDFYSLIYIFSLGEFKRHMMNIFPDQGIPFAERQCQIINCLHLPLNYCVQLFVFRFHCPLSHMIVLKVLGQRLVFAGSVVRPHCVLNIAGCEDSKTVAPLIKSKDDLVTVHNLYCPQEPFNNINYKSH